VEPDTSLPPYCPTKDPQDWTPYQNCVEFQVTNFLYKDSQMSAGDVNTLLKLWEASLAAHSETPPFESNDKLYAMINSTPLGDVP
jgi:hypothetical protein